MIKPAPNIPGPLGRRPRRWRAFWIRRIAPLSALLSEILPRLFDVLLAGGLLVILAPLLALRAVISITQTGRVLERTSAVGRFRQPIERLAFASSHIGKSWPLLVNILRGDLAFAGPRLLTPVEAERVPVEDAVRFSVRPGVISPHALRRRVGIAYEAEGASDREFVYGETLKGNAGLVARSAVGSLLGGKAPQATSPLIEFFRHSHRERHDAGGRGLDCGSCPRQ
ncbi:MAG: sugar transferase [Candidatus Competibacteraceae bacterium]|nr:sugar transferase [Candidatus Competibacteraceae bacterium]